MREKLNIKEDRCPVCSELNTLDEFRNPIEYWACRNCEAVFVVGDDNFIGCLAYNVRYTPKKK